MKTRNLVLVSIIIAFTISVQAEIQFGLRAGISSTTVNIKNFNNPNYKLEYNKGDFGYHFGGIAQYKLSLLFIQPELLYTISKTDVAFTDVNGANNTKQLGRQVFNSIDLPVMVGLKLRVFKFQVGPVVTWMINSKSAMLESNNVSPTLNSFIFGYQAGLGVQLSSLLLDAKYEANLSSLGTGMEIGGTTHVKFDQMMSGFKISIGYLF
jgi:hypothetical protein